MGLLGEMPCRSLAVDLVSCSGAISTCERSMQDARVGRLLQDMIHPLAVLNVVNRSAAIATYEKGDQWQEALSLLLERAHHLLALTVVN